MPLNQSLWVNKLCNKVKTLRKEENGKKGYISLTWLLSQYILRAEQDLGSGPSRTWQDLVDLVEYGRIW